MDDTISRIEVLDFINSLEDRAKANGDGIVTNTVLVTTECIKSFVSNMPSIQESEEKER